MKKRLLDEIPDAATLETKWMEQDALIRSITVIGEAATKILKADSTFEARHSEVPWQQVSAMRHRVVHDDFEIDLDVVWSTVRQDLSTLKQQIQHILTRSRLSATRNGVTAVMCLALGMRNLPPPSMSICTDRVPMLRPFKGVFRVFRYRES